MSNENLAVIANRLQVPVIVQDILSGQNTLSDDVHMGLHEVISDFQPDSALLSIALSAQTIANIYGEASPSMKVMGVECARIIEDYGQLWLENAKSGQVDENQVFSVLSHITEDLEGLAELIELNESFLRTKDNDAAMLCDILNIQAKAHAMIADQFMNAVDAVMENRDISVPTPAAINDNIIQFPVQTD